MSNRFEKGGFSPPAEGAGKHEPMDSRVVTGKDAKGDDQMGRFGY